MPYLCVGLWNTRFQPFRVLPDLGVSIQVNIAGMNIAPASATPITDSNASVRNVFNVTLNFGSVILQRKYMMEEIWKKTGQVILRQQQI